MAQPNLTRWMAWGLLPCLVQPVYAQNPPIAESWAKDFLQNLNRIASTDNIKPNALATRAQLALALDLMLPKGSFSPQDVPRDVAPDAPSAQAIARVVKILSADNGKFHPDRPVTKGEVLLAIAKVLSLDQQGMATPQTYLATMFVDAKTIPPSAVTAIAALTTRALVVNYPHLRHLRFHQPLTELELAP